MVSMAGFPLSWLLPKLGPNVWYGQVFYSPIVFAVLLHFVKYSRISIARQVMNQAMAKASDLAFNYSADAGLHALAPARTLLRQKVEYTENCPVILCTLSINNE